MKPDIAAFMAARVRKHISEHSAAVAMSEADVAG
jgi:hypothetical protein